MGRITEVWLDWGSRFRSHVRAKGMKWATVADNAGVAEPTVRSWINGTRDINLKDFFRLCEAADANPAEILFRSSTLDPEQREALRKVVTSILDEDQLEATTNDIRAPKRRAR